MFTHIHIHVLIGTCTYIADVLVEVLHRAVSEDEAARVLVDLRAPELLEALLADELLYQWFNII